MSLLHHVGNRFQAAESAYKWDGAIERLGDFDIDLGSRFLSTIPSKKKYSNPKTHTTRGPILCFKGPELADDPVRGAEACAVTAL